MKEAFKNLELPKETPAVEPYPTKYYDLLNEVVDDAFENATDKQLISMSVYAVTIPKLIKQELARRASK